jgi:hypothetical protein
VTRAQIGDVVATLPAGLTYELRNVITHTTVTFYVLDVLPPWAVVSPLFAGRKFAGRRVRVRQEPAFVMSAELRAAALHLRRAEVRTVPTAAVLDLAASHILAAERRGVDELDVLIAARDELDRLSTLDLPEA